MLTLYLAWYLYQTQLLLCVVLAVNEHFECFYEYHGLALKLCHQTLEDLEIYLLVGV